MRAYPFMFQLSGGEVFHAGNNRALGAGFPPPVTRVLDTILETWTDVPAAQGDVWGASAVMFKPDWVLKAGGRVAGTAIQTTMRINMKAANPTWDTVADLNCGRTHTQLVVLPDGKVLAVGGDADACDFEYHAVLPAELYDPAADTWTLMAGTNVSRWVHSIALLLPDGRVLTANGEPPCEVCDLCGGLNNYATEQECLNDPMCNASTCSHWD